MKICPVCRLHVEDDYLYCWEDGTRLVRMANETAQLAGTSEAVVRAPFAGLPDESDPGDSRSILYCPACDGEYPLTFTTCPLDHQLLGSRRKGRVKASQAVVLVIEDQPQRLAGLPDAIVETDVPEEPAPEEVYVEPDAPFAVESKAPRPNLGQRAQELRYRASRFWKGLAGPKPSASLAESSGWSAELFGSSSAVEGTPSRGMRLAARFTLIGLGLIALTGFYIVFSQVRRAPPRASVRMEKQSAPAISESPLIVTPPEAREWREESEPVTIPPQESDVERQKARSQAGAPVPAPVPARRANQIPPVSATRSALPPSIHEPPPATAGGRFNAQLIRVRSYRSRSGYRYDLTFNLLEQAGRPMRWDRLTVVTQSARGSTHSESLPFQYWQAPSGSLTFTVNVEMPGPSEADWRGRISCTSVGLDQTGRSLHASFGANVSP